MGHVPASHPLRQLFAGLTEQTFLTQLGIGDPNLIDYLSELLSRFIHMDDFTLFWTGVYPEALSRLRSALNKDSFIDYCEQGKRSYYIASTFEEDPYREEAPVLRRLSSEFELCAYGLNQVRREWESKR